MAIIIDRKITINNDQATLDRPIYLYIEDGDITCLFTIEEKRKRAATFGSKDDNYYSLPINEDTSYGQVRIYKPDKGSDSTSRLVFTSKAEIINDKLQVTFSREYIDEFSEAGIHKLQIHLYDNEDNRFTIPPVDLHVLMPVGCDNNTTDEAIAGYSLLDRAGEEVLELFDEDGNYNKTEWQIGDIITSNKLNKIEDVLYEIKTTSNESVDISALEAELENKASIVHKHSAADITTGLARVATSGSYNDLTNKPNFATTAQLNNKADRTHDHDDEYAAKDHTHDNYGNYDSNHTHDNYVTTAQLANKADRDHDHDGKYAPNSHNHDDKYASNSHNHDDKYASNGHAHDNYSVNGHTHSGYASSTHGHDDKYAPANHTHDYALTNHAHDDKYMTKTELESRYATKDYVIEYVRDNGGTGGDPGTGEGGNANIDDESISKYTVYSSSKVHDLVTQLSAVDTQLEDDLVDIDARMVYVEAEIAAIKDNTPDAGDDDEIDYVTEEELNTALAGKSDVGHIHDYALNNHIHDDRYALKTDIPNIPNNVSSFTNDAKYITSNTIIRIEVVNELPSEQVPGVLYIVKAQ